jgi:hypothetical protein
MSLSIGDAAGQEIPGAEEWSVLVQLAKEFSVMELVKGRLYERYEQGDARQPTLGLSNAFCGYGHGE